MMTSHIRYDDSHGALLLLDQRYLPYRESTFVCQCVEDIVTALQVMVIRGAPAIGVTAGFGCALAVRQAAKAGGDWKTKLDELLTIIEEARPTAVNLRWGVRRMRTLWRANPDADAVALEAIFLAEAKTMQADDDAINRRMGGFGADLLEDGDTVMTHCNAGALATAGWGTALGVVYSAAQQGKKITVVANETRPFLQGARLTAYELHKAGIEVSVACDNACGLLMQKGLISKVVVGADRIAANGDVANKIGTYAVAVLAKHHGVPFYVAAPASTFDLECPQGSLIPIEERPPEEVTHPTGETQITPVGVAVYNYAFDITPNGLVTAIVTDQGVLTPPYTQAIAEKIGKA